MNLKRVIPVLSISGNQLVKTLAFDKPRYVGDPINAIKIFNEKEVDELVILDIRASKDGREPNYKLIHEMAGESFMPVAYGGGIRTFDQAKKVFDCGVEKVIINTMAFENPDLITDLAGHFGSQSVVVSLDYKKKFLSGLKPCFLSATKFSKDSITAIAKQMEESGAGEIILQDADRDGTFSGFDLETIAAVVHTVKIPVVACAGAANAADFKKAIQSGASAVAAGSMFVFKNNNRESILINYSNKY